MKRLFYILLCFVFGSANAQLNLVQNGSFENVMCCPTNSQEIENNTNCIPGWFNPNGASPDYYNVCSGNGYTVPYHWGDYQPAKSGVAYAGFLTFLGVSSNGREYVEGTLTSSLLAGRKYCVSFYVCSAEKMLYQTDAFGAYFSTDSLTDYATVQYFQVQPQVENSSGNVIRDTMNWTLISGEFIATGGERYITIGSFKSNAATTFDTTSWGTDGRAYYYIDDVAVVYCDPTVSNAPATNPKINPTHPEPIGPLLIPTLIGPGETFAIRSLPSGSALKLYNALGQIIYQSDNYANDLNAWELRAGIYYCRLRLPDGTEQSAKVYFQR